MAMRRVDKFVAQFIHTPRRADWGWIILGEDGLPLDFVSKDYEGVGMRAEGPHDALNEHPTYGAVPVRPLQIEVTTSHFNSYFQVRPMLTFIEVTERDFRDKQASYVDA